jgi:hypothetical protein
VASFDSGDNEYGDVVPERSRSWRAALVFAYSKYRCGLLGENDDDDDGDGAADVAVDVGVGVGAEGRCWWCSDTGACGHWNNS